MPPETEQARHDRTGLASLRMSDAASAAVQKTPNRVTLDSMLDKIAHEEIIHPQSMPHMTIVLVVLKNGYAMLGKSVPADAANFDADLGYKFAKEDAIRQMWSLEAYLLRERMPTGPEESPEDANAR